MKKEKKGKLLNVLTFGVIKENKMKIKLIFVLFLIINALPTNAEEFLSVETDKNTYNYVSHYQVEVDAQPDKVWKQLIDLGSWMYEFEMSHYSGTKEQVGEVLRLYPEQDYFVQVTGVVPNELLTIANLPATFNGEYSTGIGVITLNKIKSKTVVNFTMSRRYTWSGEGENPMKTKRKSPEFQKATESTWNKFLQKLKTLTEGA